MASYSIDFFSVMAIAQNLGAAAMLGPEKGAHVVGTDAGNSGVDEVVQLMQSWSVSNQAELTALLQSGADGAGAAAHTLQNADTAVGKSADDQH